MVGRLRVAALGTLESHSIGVGRLVGGMVMVGQYGIIEFMHASTGLERPVNHACGNVCIHSYPYAMILASAPTNCPSIIPFYVSKAS